MSDPTRTVKANATGVLTSALTAILVCAGIAVAAAAMPTLGAAAGQTGRDAIALHASVMPGISPGTRRTVHLAASNAGSSAVSIARVHLVDVSPDAGHKTCVTDDFTMADVAQKTSVPGHTRTHELESGTLVYTNTNVNQDACRGVTLTLTFSSTSA
jgi:hypothetical protein